MENHTKRMRKARRQGLADHGKNLGRTARGRFSAGMPGADVPSEPRATERRKELSTGRKTKRQEARRTSRLTKRPVLS